MTEPIGESMERKEHTEIPIRAVEPRDLAALVEFLRPFVEEGRLLPRTEDELEDLVANSFVAETAGRIVGFSAVDVYSRKLAELRSLAVDPEFQRKGIGRRLVEACVQRAREHGVREVMAITSAESFFKSCGFDFALPGEKKALFIQLSESPTL